MMIAIFNFTPGDAGTNTSGGTTVSTYILGGSLALLILAWAALRYWLAVSQKSKHDEISTPTIDRLNVEALSQIGDENKLPMEPVHEPAPDDLLAVVPEDAHLQKPPTTSTVDLPNPYAAKK